MTHHTFISTIAGLIMIGWVVGWTLLMCYFGDKGDPRNKA